MIVGQSRPVSGTDLWGLIGLIVRDLFDFFPWDFLDVCAAQVIYEPAAAVGF